MGIDALDLVFRLEKRFGITISRHAALASCFNTAGDIHRYLVAKLRSECGQVPRIERLTVPVAVFQMVRGKLTPRFVQGVSQPPAAE